LKCGTVQAGDAWHPEVSAKPLAWLTVNDTNFVIIAESARERIEKILATPELAEGWKRLFLAKSGSESPI
jgi:hypothetical protein